MKEIGPSEVDVNSIDLWVVSHGGVASNAICDFLEINGIRTRPDNYGLICHKMHPGSGVNIPILVAVSYTHLTLPTSDLEYPYKIKDAEEKLKKLGFEVDLSDFSLRERKKKFGLISKEVKYLLEIYGELNFP